MPEEIILHGDLNGLVTDAETGQPLQSASLELNQFNITSDTVTTQSDGKYIFRNLAPGEYEIQVSKQTYQEATKEVKIETVNTSTVNFALKKAAHPAFSGVPLDFGFESSIMTFTISNAGKGSFSYALTPHQPWISVFPATGEVTNETDTIIVSINRNGLTVKKQEETISIISYIEEGIKEDEIELLVNGIMDVDENYYGIVTIGTQTWMAENLNTGISIDYGVSSVQRQTNNGIAEKYCWGNDDEMCDTYGGLYAWEEMMDYNPMDTGEIGTTQGFCPSGWHIPTRREWETLAEYLGGFEVAGGKLKADSPLWGGDNIGATNESGFTALPAGYVFSTFGFRLEREVAIFWNSFRDSTDGKSFYFLTYGTASFREGNLFYGIESTSGRMPDGASVRCVQDPK